MSSQISGEISTTTTNSVFRGEEALKRGVGVKFGYVSLSVLTFYLPASDILKARGGSIDTSLIMVTQLCSESGAGESGGSCRSGLQHNVSVNNHGVIKDADLYIEEESLTVRSHL